MLVRINKYLSDKKICSRRRADKLIKDGLVFINGKKAKIGQIIDTDKDKVEVKARLEYRYFLFNKPRGIVSYKTTKNEKDAISAAKLNRKEFAVVGRLDKDSEGLLLITNDGRIVNRLLNPKFEHEREYLVWVNKNIKSSHIKELEKGVNIEGYKTKPAKAKKISDRLIKIILKEGKKHQIRRMMTALGYQVERLKRTRIMNLSVEGIKEGEKKELTGDKLKLFLDKLGIN